MTWKSRLFLVSASFLVGLYIGGSRGSNFRNTSKSTSNNSFRMEQRVVPEETTDERQCDGARPNTSWRFLSNTT